MIKSIKDSLGGSPFSDENNPVLSEVAVAFEYAVTSNQIVRATWADLETTVGSINWQGGEVLTADSGSHQQATATGYNGATVDNAGRYSWDATWGLWVRIGDNDLSLMASAVSLQLLIDDLKDVATSGSADDLSDGEEKFLLTTGERSKLTHVSVSKAVDLDALTGGVDGVSEALMNLHQVADSGNSDDLDEGEEQLLLTVPEREKLGLVSATEPVDLDALRTSTQVVIESFTVFGGSFFERGSSPAPTLNWQFNSDSTISAISINGTALDAADRSWVAPVISDDETYVLSVEDNVGRQTTATVTFYRALPVYFGAANPVDPDDMTSQEAQDLTGLRLGSELQGSYEISTIGTQYVYLVAPSSFAAPVRVRVNGFDVADPFVSDTKGLTTAYGVDANYIFYRLELPYTDTTLILEID